MKIEDFKDESAPKSPNFPKLENLGGLFTI